MKWGDVRDIGGIWVALVTPWDENRGQPRRKTLKGLVNRFAYAGVDGLFILGTTGEGFLFAPEERKLFVEVVVEEAEGHFPIIVHVGHESTKVAMDLAAHAQKAGAQAVAVAPPSRYKLDRQELEEHFIAVAEAAADLPVLLYDIPIAGYNEIEAVFLAQIHKKVPKIVGVKSSRSDWSAWDKYLQVADSLIILVGSDLLCLPLLLLGARGVVSGPANVFPELYVELFKRVKDKDIEGAIRYQQLINKLCKALHHGQPLAYIKEALRELGWDVGKVRRPLRPLNEKEREQLREALIELARAWETNEGARKEVIGESKKRTKSWLSGLKNIKNIKEVAS